jgi:hypothetical protein
MVSTCDVHMYQLAASMGYPAMYTRSKDDGNWRQAAGMV